MTEVISPWLVGGKISGVVEALEAPNYPSPHLTAGGGHGMAKRKSIARPTNCPKCGIVFVNTKKPRARCCSKKCAAAMRDTRPVSERFWLKVDKSAGPSSCWPWIGARSDSGYGAFDKTRAHRVAFALAYGPIPDGLIICHHCDNRPCCNPSHLFMGTKKDNTADMIAKGRAKFHRFGTANGSSRVRRAIRSASQARS